jgi:hypothetical protein
MKLICLQCQEEINEKQPVTVVRGEDLLLFCDTTCRNKWLFFDALDCWADDSDEIFDPKAFISSESAESTP